MVCKSPERFDPLVPGGNGIFRRILFGIAGDPERETRARRSREGIPVDQTTWQEIHAAAAKVGLAEDAVDRLAKGERPKS